MKLIDLLASAAAVFGAASANATDYSIKFVDTSSATLLTGVISVSDTVNALTGSEAGKFGRTITGLTGLYAGEAISLVSNPDAPNPFTSGDYTFDNQFIEGTGSKLNSYGLLFSYGGNVANLLGDVNGGGENDYAILGTRSFFSGSLQVTEISSAVPENSTWAMMLLGFGMMGASIRYRRRSTKVAYA